MLIVVTAMFAVFLLITSFIHRSYALKMSCRVAAFFYFFNIYINDSLLEHYTIHWVVYCGLDLILAGIILVLGGPFGAVAALLASILLGWLNAMEPYGWFYDHYEGLSLTINLAFMYYLAVHPFVHRRDRRWGDRLPAG